MGKRAEDTPQAQPPYTWTRQEPKNAGGATNGGLMPYILAGTLGLGGGGLGTSYLKPGISPAQLQEHMGRIADKIDRTAERLEDKIEDLDEKIKELDEKIEDLDEDLEEVRKQVKRSEQEIIWHM